MRFVGMVKAKKFKQSFVNEYMAWNLHDQDVKRKGKQEAHTETASRMLSMGLPLETVAQAMGLSPDFVRQLLP